MAELHDVLIRPILTEKTTQLEGADNVYTFENVTIDASSSYDVDGGFVMCYFAIQDGLRTELIDAPDCQTSWFWVDDGDWATQNWGTVNSSCTTWVDIYANFSTNCNYPAGCF